MKKLLALLVLVPAAFAGGAQNLVPNPSFERFNACPSTFSGIVQSPTYTLFPTATDWVSPLITTPDFHHACASNTTIGVPVNYGGYQLTHSGGGYAGIHAYNGMANSGREYIETKLSKPMQAGRAYHVSFYANLGTGNGATQLQTLVGHDQIAAYLSTSQVNFPNTVINLTMTPQIINPGTFVIDTVNWTKIRATYTAAGGEEWMTLGHFNTGPVNYVVVKAGANGAIRNYMFLEDVSVYDLDSPASTVVHDTSICSPGWNLTLQAPAGYDEYQWSNNATAATINVSAIGTYWVRSWKDTVYRIDSFRIHAPASLPLQLPKDTAVCSGLPLTIAANHPYSTYQWSTGATTPSITVQQSGRYILLVTDSCNAQRDTINVFYSPALQLPRDTVLCNNGQLAVSANHPYNTYLWSTGAATPGITISQSGSYILTVTDACGPQKDTVKVTVQPPVPLPVARDTTLCQGITGPKLAVTGDSLRWYVPPAGGGNYTQPVLSTSQTGTRTIYVTQTRNGCESDRKPIDITVIGKPLADLGRDTTVCDSVALLVGPSVTGGTSALWNTGETFSPIVVRKATYLRLTLTNVCGSATDDKWVRYIDCNGGPPTGTGPQSGCLYIPNAFTPNADGTNDRFRIISVCPLLRYHLEIRNRRGERVFESHDLNVQWDGTYKGQPAAMDTYFYRLEFLKDNTGNVADHLKGDLMLVR